VSMADPVSGHPTLTPRPIVTIQNPKSGVLSAPSDELLVIASLLASSKNSVKCESNPN
jgi:hypothetical protein